MEAGELFVAACGLLFLASDSEHVFKLRALCRRLAVKSSSEDFRFERELPA